MRTRISTIELLGRGLYRKLLLSGKSLDVANLGLMVKCTPERGHNALFFIPLEVIIML